MKPKRYEISISSGDGYSITIVKFLTDEQVRFIKHLDFLFDKFSTSYNRPGLEVYLYDESEV